MSGKLGVESVKSLISLAKLGWISVLQAVAKDGFQAADLLAPLSSPTFQEQAVHILEDFAKVIPELSDLDVWDGIEIGKHAYACWADLKTELNLASAKMKVAK